jgi:ligand-binding sensor domain-containing protein
MRTLLVLFLFSPILLSAQTESWTNYQSPENINKLVETDNHLWLASGDGVFTIEKNSLESVHYSPNNSGLPSDHIQDIALDNQQNPWIGTYDVALAQWNGSDWVAHLPPETLMDEHNIQTLYCIHIDEEDRILVGTDGGMLILEGDEWSYEDPLANTNFGFSVIWDIAPSPNPGKLILASFFPYEYTGDSLIDISNEAMELISYGHARTENIDNEIWYYTGISSLSRWDGAEWTHFDLFDEESWVPLPSGSIANQIWQDDEGMLWCIFGNTGAYQLQDNTWYLQEDSQLTQNPFGKIDQMWSGLDGRRWLFSNAYFSALQNDELTEAYLINHRILDNNVREIASDGNGKTFFLNGYHLSTFDGENWEVLTPFPEGNSYVWDIKASSEGVIWMSSNYGVMSMDQQGNTTYWEKGQNGLDMINTHILAPGPQGTAWVGGGYQIAFFNGQEWEVFDYTNSPLTENYMSGLLEVDQNGTLWVGNSAQELFRKTGNSWEKWTLAQLPFPSDIWWSTACIDKNDHLWLSLGQHGLAQYDGQDWTIFDEGTPLEDTYIYDLQSDDTGKIYISTTLGLMIKDGSEWSYFGPDNSPIGEDIIYTSNAPDAQTIWMGMQKTGLWHYQTEAVSAVFAPEESANPIGRAMPNPFTNQFELSLEQHHQTHTAILVDASGKVITQKRIPAGQTQVSWWTGNDLPPGIYFLYLRNDAEQSVIKLIRE